MTRRAAHYQTLTRRDLSQRQRDVLELIAAGNTNGEIAERLGISLDGAKWHVSEILGKLEVDSREAAAAWWRAESRPTARISEALTFVASALSRTSLSWAAAGAGAIGTAVVVYLVLSNGGGGSQAGDPTTSIASETPGLSATPPQNQPATPTPSAPLPAPRSTPIGGDPQALANGRLVVYTDTFESSHDRKEVVAYDLDKRRVIATFRTGGGSLLQLDANRRRVIYIDGTSVVEAKLDGTDRRVVYTLPANGSFTTFLPSPDGSRLAVGIEVGQRDPQQTKLIVVDSATLRPVVELPVAAFSVLGFSGSPAPLRWEGDSVVVFGYAGKDGTVWPTARVAMDSSITIVPPVTSGPIPAPKGALLLRTADVHIYPCTGLGYVFDAEEVVNAASNKAVATLGLEGYYLSFVEWAPDGDALLLQAFPKGVRDGNSSVPCYQGSQLAPRYYLWESAALVPVADVEEIFKRWHGYRYLQLECDGAIVSPEYPLYPEYFACDSLAPTRPATFYLGGERIDTVRQGSILGFVE